MAIIILSHVASDGEIVERMREKLAARGHRIIGSRDSPQDTSWARSFARLLHDADHVINLISHDALGNAQMTVVARLANRLGKGVDVWIGAGDPPAQLADAPDLSRWRGETKDAAWTALLARLTERRGGAEPQPPARGPEPADTPQRAPAASGAEPEARSEPVPPPPPQAAREEDRDEPAAPAPPAADPPSADGAPATVASGATTRAHVDPSASDADPDAAAAPLRVQSEIKAELDGEIAVAYSGDTVARAWGDILAVGGEDIAAPQHGGATADDAVRGAGGGLSGERDATARPGFGVASLNDPRGDVLNEALGGDFVDDSESRSGRDPRDDAQSGVGHGHAADAAWGGDGPRLYPDDEERWRAAQAAAPRSRVEDEAAPGEDGGRRPRLRRIMVRGPEETPEPAQPRTKVALEPAPEPQKRRRSKRDGPRGRLGLAIVAAVVGYAALAAIGFSQGYTSQHREAREAEQAWIAAQDTQSIRDLRVWLKRYGDSRRAEDARAALAALELARAEARERQAAALRRAARALRPGRAMSLARVTAAAVLTERAPDAPDMTDPFDSPPDQGAFTRSGEDPTLVAARRAVRRAARALLTGNRLATEIWTAEVLAAARAWSQRSG